MGFIWVTAGTGFIFLMTCLGSAAAGLIPKGSAEAAKKIFLGFAAGVMIAASIWSLLIPAIDEAEARGSIAWIPAAGGVALGVLFLFALDQVIPHLHPSSNVQEGLSSTAKRTTLMIWAVTLHNIPEGMAVGLSFSLAAQHPDDPALYASAIALAIGIGIHTFPEGAAVSLPIRQEGASAGKAILLGCLSGIVEPFFGFLAFLLAAFIAPFMPWLLSFAAGAMLYVVVEELIPEAHLGEHSNAGTLGVMAGFLLMMILDVALG
ncbi:MAG: ZIP family metal transporter [Clostridiales bacterium]|jgi:ZIP family zinc transporter|nr:ZIP family metal transporter [Clostridiales bacterium]